MALDGDALAGLMVDALEAAGVFPTEEISPGAKAEALKIWQPIANTIIDYIVSNAEIETNVSTNVDVASVSGVLTGAGVSGPGKGAGSGTGVGTIK